MIVNSIQTVFGLHLLRINGKNQMRQKKNNKKNLKHVIIKLNGKENVQ